jgi:hypothetical protein
MCHEFAECFGYLRGSVDLHRSAQPLGQFAVRETGVADGTPEEAGFLLWS